MNQKDKIDELIKKAESSKSHGFDLKSDEDLSIAIMNLISIEEHFFFTGSKTGDKKYFNLLDEARKIRTELMKKLVKNPEGENWCICKHLLATSMRLIEVGNKLLKNKEKKQAYEMYEKAFKLYSLFWGINMGAVNTKDIKKIDENAINKKQSAGLWGKLKTLVQKVIDCCIE